MSQRLFLSHSGADSSAAIELKRRICAAPQAREVGLDVWLDVEEGLVAGDVGWQVQIEEAIRTSDAFCVYVGAKGVVNWVEREVRLGLSCATGDQPIPFIPALAPGIKSGSLPPFARQHQSVRDPLGNPDALLELIRAILGDQSVTQVVERPFVGLRAMEESDAFLFFGREAEIDELITCMRTQPIVAVVADSGAGKSSLVRAGVVPAFRGGAFESDDRPQPDDQMRHVVVMRPGGDPAEGLKRAITAAADALGLDANAQAGLRRRVDLNDPSETAYALRCDLPPDRTDTLLVIDQFEELLTQSTPQDAAAFANLILALADPGAQRRVRIVLTVRADYFNLISAHPDLFGRLSADGDAAQMRLKQVTEPGLRDLVRKPLRLGGVTDDTQAEALISALRRDLSDRPSDLALAQMALDASWRKSRADGSDLATAYAAVGGAHGALAHVAEQVRGAQLSEEQGGLLFPLLVRLIRLGDTGGATRRAMRLEDLNSAHAGLADFLSGEAGGRLLTKTATEVEIGHEALITQWPWLARQVTENAGDIRLLARFSDAAAAWHRSNRARGALPNDGDRRVFEGLNTRKPLWLSAGEQDFLRAAQRRSRANTAIRRTVTAMIVVLVGVVAILGVFAFQWGADAMKERRAAEIQTWHAVENEMSAFAALSSIALTNGQPADAVRLALAGWGTGSPKNAPQVKSSIASLSDGLAQAREIDRLEGYGSYGTSPRGRRSPDSRGMGARSTASPSLQTARASPPGVPMERRGSGTSPQGQRSPALRGMRNG